MQVERGINARSVHSTAGHFSSPNYTTRPMTKRRGNKGDKGRDFRYANGLLIRQEPPDKQKGD